MKAVILCGGSGTRLRELTELQPKPMVEVGGRPIVWHILKGYAHHGVNDFILCLGYKGHMLKQYFLDYHALARDFTVTLGRRRILDFHGPEPEEDWRVTLADTGEHSLTSKRLARIWPYLDADETFCLTYGDGVCDLDFPAALAFHRSCGRLATITGVRPPARFGEIEHENGLATAFWEKPAATAGLINGGFFFIEPGFRRYLPPADEEEMLERGPLRRCMRDGQLSVYVHTGFWQCMDTYRDWLHLETLWNENRAPWKIWT